MGAKEFSPDAIWLSHFAAELRRILRANIALGQILVPMTQCVVEQTSLQLTHFASEEYAVRVTQCAVEAFSVPIAQFGIEPSHVPSAACIEPETCVESSGGVLILSDPGARQPLMLPLLSKILPTIQYDRLVPQPSRIKFLESQDRSSCPNVR